MTRAREFERNKEQSWSQDKEGYSQHEIKTLDGMAVQLGVDDQSGEKRRRGKELKGGVFPREEW